MLAAPPSWRAATNRTPPARSAFVTSKLPLPTTPNAVPTPRPASVRPTSSATFTAPPARSTRAGLPDPPTIGSGETTSSVAGRRQRGQVPQLRQAVLPGAQQEFVAREHRLERRRLARVGADGLDAEPDDRRFLGEPARALGRDAGGVRPGLVGVEEAAPGRRCARPSRCGTAASRRRAAGRARPSTRGRRRSRAGSRDPARPAPRSPARPRARSSVFSGTCETS